MSSPVQNLAYNIVYGGLALGFGGGALQAVSTCLEEDADKLPLQQRIKRAALFGTVGAVTGGLAAITTEIGTGLAIVGLTESNTADALCLMGIGAGIAWIGIKAATIIMDTDTVSKWKSLMFTFFRQIANGNRLEEMTLARDIDSL